MKILIAVPTFENIQPEVFKSIYDLDTSGYETDFDFVKGYDVAMARSRIAKKAIECGYDYVMMVDSDTVIPKDALVNMLDPETDIVLGCCPRKNSKTRMSALCTLKDNPTGTGYHVSLNYDALQGEERIKLAVGGFACALIDTDVFRNMKYPYFRYLQYGNGSILSEDFYFCEQAGLSGYEVWADPRVKCGHLARYYQYE